MNTGMLKGYHYSIPLMLALKLVCVGRWLKQCIYFWNREQWREIQMARGGMGISLNTLYFFPVFPHFKFSPYRGLTNLGLWHFQGPKSHGLLVFGIFLGQQRPWEHFALCLLEQHVDNSHPNTDLKFNSFSAAPAQQSLLSNGLIPWLKQASLQGPSPLRGCLS